MLSAILGFEVRYQLRQPLFYVCSTIFFLMTFGAITTDAIQIGGAIGNVDRNSSFVIMQIALVMSMVGVFATTAFVASSVHRDFEYGTFPLFFSKPITKTQYLGGRFIGSLIVAFLVFFSVMAAIAIGSMMPWLEPERISAFVLTPYLFSLFVLILPNVLLTGAIFFSLAALTRSMFYTYVGVAAFFVAYIVASAFMADMESQFLATLLDPFGFAAFGFATKYWTVFERNSAILPLEGAFLYNRLLWSIVGLAVLAVSFARFSFSPSEKKGKRKITDDDIPLQAPAVAIPRPRQDFSTLASWRQYLYQAKLETRGILFGIPSIVLLFFGVLNVVGNSFGLDQLFGTTVYPVTHIMVQIIAGGFLLFALIILTFYSGEIVWRERALKLSDVYDSLPTPTWIQWAAKITALVSATFILLAAAVLTTIAIQLFRGYTAIEPMLYLKGVFFEIGVPLALIAVLAMVLQIVINHKFAAMLLMIVYYISLFVLPAVGLEHVLYRYGASPPAPYSDMNGYGHFVAPMLWSYLYWTIFAVILLLAGHLLWVRGTENGWRQRLAIAAQRLGPGARSVGVVALAVFTIIGGYIFYNTNVLNAYETTKAGERRLAEYEKKYKQYETIAQPRITDVRADVDIYPEERRVVVRGTYDLENRSGEEISQLHFTISPDLTVHRLEVPGTIELEDRSYRIYRLTRPMQPGERFQLPFEVALENHGFRNDRGSTAVVYNGSFFNNYEAFPTIGYVSATELQDRSKRRKYGLDPIQRMPKITDEAARQNNYISRQADWINFQTTVSTSVDQIALAPGYLKREWVENGRRYFHYEMDSPILGFWAYLSARWEVKRDQWNGVAIEVYYDSKHPYNVDRMIDGVKKSLDYFTANFGPYQHRQVRIVEFPRYARFAQAFPNTIPFSESIGFIANLKDEEAIDYVFYVTAHEVAHQWWAHQVIGANVQGATVLSETLSQYSALMVMEKEYGPEKMRRFLKYELDHYLQGRGGELVEELPLYLVENQPYIHYRKGSVVMYALRDAIGEDRLNEALRNYRNEVAFQQPPYTTTLELMAHLRSATPPDKQQLLSDLFERIVLYDIRATDVTYQQRADGRYVVQIRGEGRKFEADGKGIETERDLDDWIDIAVFGETQKGRKKEETVLFLEKRRLSGPQLSIEVVVDELPVRAGFDPFSKMIDRNPDDNVRRASAGS